MLDETMGNSRRAAEMFGEDIGIEEIAHSGISRVDR